MLIRSCLHASLPPGRNPQLKACIAKRRIAKSRVLPSPTRSCRLFVCLWLLHLGVMLLLPRWLGPRYAHSITLSPLFQPPNAQQQAQHGRSRAQRLALWLQRGVAAVALWPAAALVLTATVTSVWLPMVRPKLKIHHQHTPSPQPVTSYVTL